MRITLLTIIALTLSFIALGQSPEGFKYQAVIRDAGNLILTDQAVGMQLSIQQGSIGGTSVYTETFSITTNAYGLVNLEIGTGISTDDFTIIDWANGPYFMETAVDITGGMTYEVMGTSQLMSVPYALYAKTSGNGEGPQGPAGVDGVDGAPGPAGENGINGANGPAGADGVDGTPGPQGLQGAMGANGTNGVNGINGLDGANGLQGAQGIQGEAGVNGQNGSDGAQGIQGETGLQGEQGIAGTNGTDGVAGEAGPQGETGPAGTDGNDGATGPAGADGNDGATGPAGANGTNGATGPAGTNGTNGATGPAGADGNDGATGPAGADGNDGATGPAGTDGNDGATGLTGVDGNDGATGPAGAQGAQGDIGVQGPTGPQGETGVAGSQGETGVAGPQGEIGVTGPQGETGVAGTQGEQGLAGPQGETGVAGPQGETGVSGPQGETGVAGPQGEIGVTGPQGETGVAGPQGETGVAGPQGETGLTGDQGIQGVAGSVGAQGIQGAQGDFGLTGDQGLQGIAGVNGIDAVLDYDSLANIITADSSFTANVSGVIGGGCDFAWPEGLEGEGLNIVLNSSSGYTVPLGKRLYIINVINAASFFLNGLLFDPPFDNPLIANSGDELTAIGNSGKMRGLLVDENLGLEALTFPINTETDGYTVPLGKKFYITNTGPGSVTIYLNGNGFNLYTDKLTILNSGNVVTQNGNINGYLVDEDYFAGCGGGGSASASSNSPNSLVSLPVNYPDSTGVNSISTTNYSYGDMVMNYSDGSVLVLAPGLDNNNLDYLFSTMPTCNSSISSITNEEHYISFQVTDTIIIKETFQVMYGYYSSCNSPEGYIPTIYRNGNTVNYDPNSDGIGSSSGTNMLFPGFTYSMKCGVYMANSNAADSYKITYVSQFTVNPFFTNVSYFHQNLGDATYYTSNQFPLLMGLGFSFSLPIPVWIGL